MAPRSTRTTLLRFFLPLDHCKFLVKCLRYSCQDSVSILDIYSNWPFRSMPASGLLADLYLVVSQLKAGNPTPQCYFVHLTSSPEPEIWQTHWEQHIPFSQGLLSQGQTRSRSYSETQHRRPMRLARASNSGVAQSVSSSSCHTSTCIVTISWILYINTIH